MEGRPIAYADGQLKATGQTCNGTAALAACVVGTAQVDAAGNWSFDQVGTPGGAKATGGSAVR